MCLSMWKETRSHFEGVKKAMSKRDYEEGYEDARREMQEREFGSPRRGGDFTAAVLIKYLAIIVVVIIVAYVVLQILGVIQGAFYRVP